MTDHYIFKNIQLRNVRSSVRKNSFQILIKSEKVKNFNQANNDALSLKSHAGSIFKSVFAFHLTQPAVFSSAQVPGESGALLCHMRSVRDCA